jgi:acetyl-CoA carboxylase carboxyl transferase beta subunit
VTGEEGVWPLVRLVLDPGTWRSWDDGEPVGVWTNPEYAEQLAAARARTGMAESVLTGEGRIEGRRVAVALCDFRFLAGTIGVVSAERLVRCAERATAERLPLIASPASGGTRMQEGTIAFLQMAKISAAVARHRAAGLPYLVYLRHPTTGGVLASWGSLGHVTAAEPGALIGFLGPRVYEALHGRPFPDVQRAENLHAHGLIDAVVPPAELREVAARILRVLVPTEHRAPAGEPATSAGEGGGEPSAWEVVTRSRRPDRPGVRELLNTAATDVTPLHGTAEGEHGPGIVMALARFGGASCVVVGQDRYRQDPLGSIGPAALRKGRRGMRLSAELGLPLVTVIDTAGAELSAAAEQGGLAGEVARCLADLLALPAPSLAVLLGQGSGGAALALLPADRVVAAEYSWLGALPPEGAAAILHRSVGRAAEVAGWQGIRAGDLRRAGLVDHVVAEGPVGGDGPTGFLTRLGATVAAVLSDLVAEPQADRLAARYRRYRLLGLEERSRG